MSRYAFLLIALQVLSEEFFSYDPFFYGDRDFIKLLGIMDEKINLNGNWYQVKDTFEGLSIKKIEGDCVILGEKKICLMKKRFLEE